MRIKRAARALMKNPLELAALSLSDALCGFDFRWQDEAQRDPALIKSRGGLAALPFSKGHADKTPFNNKKRAARGKTSGGALCIFEGIAVRCDP